MATINIIGMITSIKIDFILSLASKNNSSTVTLRFFAKSKANRNVGPYVSFSIALIIYLETWQHLACASGELT